MIRIAKENRLFDVRFGDLQLMKAPEQTLAFTRGKLLMAFNFHASESLTNLLIPVPANKDYVLILSSDDAKFGGWDRVVHQTYPVKKFEDRYYVELYLPARTAVVLRQL